MPGAKESPSWKVLLVVLPVVVGSLLGSITTITSNYYSQKLQREEEHRKEEASLRATQRNERKKNISDGAELCSRLMRNLEQVKTLGYPKETDYQVKTALTDMDIFLALNLPSLGQDVGQVRQACEQFLDHLHFAESSGQKELFLKNDEKEVAPVIESIRSLLGKLSTSGTGIEPLRAIPTPTVTTAVTNG